MKVNLTTGITDLKPGWEILLQQLGVSYRKIEADDALTPERYGVIIVNCTLNERRAAAIRQYLEQGGSVLDAGHLMEKISSRKFTTRNIRSIFPAEHDSPFREIDVIDLHSQTRIVENAHHLQKTVSLQTIGKGFLAFLGLDVNRLLTDTRSMRKQFYSPTGDFPNEIVAKISKGEIVKLVRLLIRWLTFQRKLPFAHLWYFPGKQRNIFAFRIDSDYSTPEQLETYHDVALKYGMKLTWFLHGETHENHMDIFRRFDDQELAVHGYKHHTYHTAAKNLQNIRRAKSLLDRHQIKYEGFAAPYGAWNPGLAQASEEAGFTYASEFSLDYDNYPFTPWIDSRFSDVLQVPVHPVCTGSFKRIRGSEATMKAYFRYIIAKKLSQNQPLIFYDHPGHRYLDVIESLFEHIKELQIENLTFAEYARWWRRRQNTQWQACFENGKLTVDLQTPHDGISLAVHISPGERCYAAQSGTFSLQEMTRFTAPPPPETNRKKLAAIRRFNPNLIKYSILDSYWRREK